MRTNTKKLCTLAVSVALAMILSFVESQIPPLATVPGVKIGLANVVSVFLLYSLGAPYAITVSFVRVILSSLLFGSILSLWYSLAGAVLSLLVMVTVKRLQFFSSVGVSVLGGVFHNIAQTAVAILVMDSLAIAVYLPPLLASGVIAGVVVGILGGILTKRLEPYIKK